MSERLKNYIAPVSRYAPWALIGVLSLAGMYVVSLYNYLLFHSLAESFTIVIAFGIFVVIWNARRFIDNNYLTFIGIAYLFVAFIDLIHALAYKGMGVFPTYNANPATQLWIIARYMESISLLIAPVFIHRKLRPWPLFAIYTLTTILLLLSVFYWNVFPTCYIEGQGLTEFKILSEYIISLILAGSLVLLWINKKSFDNDVLGLLIASIIITIGSELAFTAYVSVYGFANMLGHMLKLISFYLIYVAILVTGLQKPYRLLFREIKQREEEVLGLNLKLEEKIAERTRKLVETNEELSLALSNKDALLKEVNHRVKNNLMVISSLLNLQMKRTSNVTARAALQESNTRVMSMAMIHEQVLRSGKYATIDCLSYVNALTTNLRNSVAPDHKNIRLTIDIEPGIKIELDRAVNLGLIINELVSNSFKHAFPDCEKGEISISCRSSEDQVQLSIRDSGMGITDGIDVDHPSSLGLQLVNILIKQMDGTIKYERDGGAKFTIMFSKKLISNTEVK